LAKAEQEGTGDLTLAADHLGRAVDGLRKAGLQHHIPRGLLARAALHRVGRDFERARRDLDEAMSIAERGGMRLHQADAHLAYVRLHLAMGDGAKAREHLDTAKEMVEDMGYHRRDGEVAELEDAVKE
jgi:exonuclease VII small subunit